MSEPLEGYAKFYIEIIEAVIARLETLPDPNMLPVAFVIPRPDVMTEGTTAKSEHAVTVDVVVLHKQLDATEGLRKSSILGGKCYDTIIADRSLGGQVRFVGGNRRFEPDYMFGRERGKGVLHWILIRVQAFKMRID